MFVIRRSAAYILPLCALSILGSGCLLKTNTDAEGRLVLADALHWTQEEFKPARVLDFATLTGAMIIALGHEFAGVFSNDDELARQLERWFERPDDAVAAGAAAKSVVEANRGALERQVTALANYLPAPDA